MLNIVIPMAGRGSRFASAGFTDPKPLIPLHGVPMIRLVIANLAPKVPHRFIFICQREHYHAYGLDSLLPQWTVDPQVILLDGVTEGAACTGAYRNVVVSRVNDSCLRLSAFEGDYRWHFHPGSDELFVVVDGQLAIDLADGSTLCLGPWDTVTIPAGMIHRTRALPRAVNLTVEHFGAETTFVASPIP